MKRKNEEYLTSSMVLYEVIIRGVERPIMIWAETAAEAAVMALIRVDRPGLAIFSIAVMHGSTLELFQGAKSASIATVSLMVVSKRETLKDTVLQDLDGMSVV